MIYLFGLHVFNKLAWLFLWNGDIYTPVALSIVQGRFVGLVHFSAGFILTYPPFIIGQPIASINTGPIYYL